MATCDVCDGAAEHLVKCNICEREHCAEHRLPEKHECSGLNVSEWSRGLEGDGPSTRDRRGTRRKRIERVRAKQTSRENPPADNWRRTEKERRTENTSKTDVLTCPNCGTSTDCIQECNKCEQSICPKCREADAHDCPVVEPPTEEVADSTLDSIFGRLLSILR
jgi:predicted nucleic acid binding AN1-type Zn finger protein